MKKWKRRAKALKKIVKTLTTVNEVNTRLLQQWMKTTGCEHPDDIKYEILYRELTKEDLKSGTKLRTVENEAFPEETCGFVELYEPDLHRPNVWTVKCPDGSYQAVHEDTLLDPERFKILDVLTISFGDTNVPVKV